eukprot:1778670-Rhodomonas_salina.4
MRVLIQLILNQVWQLYCPLSLAALVRRARVGPYDPRLALPTRNRQRLPSPGAMLWSAENEVE